ncbi:MAG TPA: hypothetical protein VME42_19390 [Steroidobacteraceae bacterium]|nr:hypothetical protein [Steroidobacteraceae bacterium]
MLQLHQVQLGKMTAVLCAGLLMLAACTSQREPAQKMMNDIATAVGAASDDAAKYAPDQLNDVQTKLDDLKTAFDAHDYKGVLARGPAILAEAQGLAGAVAAKKAQIAKDQNAQWTALSGAIPGEFSAVQSRLDELSKKKNRKKAAGIDLDAAKSGLAAASSEWSKAQGAFGNGNMSEAVSTAKDVKDKLDGLAATLKVELPAAPAS